MRTWRVSASATLRPSAGILTALCLFWSTPGLAVSNLTIIADDSVSVAVSKLARDYARIENIGVSTSFAEKHLQSEQINEGSAVDILITTDTKWLEELQNQGLIDIHSKTEFGRGRLALVGPEDSTLVMKLTRNFMAAPLVHAMKGEQELLLGNPEYMPVGKYAKEALRNLGGLDVLEPYTLYLKSSDDMMNEVVEKGAYGIFPYGEAQLMERAKVIDLFPEDSHGPIIYYAVVIAGDRMDEARKFLRFIASPQAKAALRNSGMGTL